MSTKWFVTATCVIALLWRRDAFTCSYIIGGAGSGVLAKVLKYVLNQSRPTSVAPDPGMPSSHAMNLFYLTYFLAQVHPPCIL